MVDTQDESSVLQEEEKCALAAFEHNDFESAKTRYRKAAQLSSVLRGEKDMDTLRDKLNLADSCTNTGQRDEAVRIYVEVYKAANEKRNAERNDDLVDILEIILTGRHEHGQVYYKAGRLDKAVRTLRDTLSDSRESLPRNRKLISAIESDLRVVEGDIEERARRLKLMEERKRLNQGSPKGQIDPRSSLQKSQHQEPQSGRSLRDVQGISIPSFKVDLQSTKDEKKANVDSTKRTLSMILRFVVVIMC